MSTQPELFHESLDEALREVVQAAGGSKRIGHAMRPELPADAAGRWVLDCLNADRAAHFNPDQVLWLLMEGRRIGCHAAAKFLLRESGYAEPVTVDPQTQVERLTQTIANGAEQVRLALAALERMEQGGIGRVVPARAGIGTVK